MDCQKAQSLAGKFTDGTISKSNVSEYIAHIRKCSECRNDLEIAFLLNQSLEGMDLKEKGYDFHNHLNRYIDRMQKEADDILTIQFLGIGVAVFGVVYFILQLIQAI